MGLQEKAEEGFETCIRCKELTSVRKDASRDARGETYIDGIGQSCGKCYTDVYGKSTSDRTITVIELSDFGILV